MRALLLVGILLVPFLLAACGSDDDDSGTESSSTEAATDGTEAGTVLVKDIYPGSSGSPVFDNQGRLVGMVKGRYRGTTTVGFVTPLETIVAFLLHPDD